MVHAFEDAACVTLVAGSSPDALITALGGSVDEVVAEDEDAYGASVLVASVPGGVVAVEPNGFQGSLPEALARVAGSGRAASMFWNVNALSAFSWCDGSLGAQVSSIEMLSTGDADEDFAYFAESDLPLELHDLAALASNDGIAWQVGIALAVAYTGVPAGSEEQIKAGTYYRLPQ